MSDSISLSDGKLLGFTVAGNRYPQLPQYRQYNAHTVDSKSLILIATRM